MLCGKFSIGNLYRFEKKSSKHACRGLTRGGSRDAAASKMERFVIS